MIWYMVAYRLDKLLHVTIGYMILAKAFIYNRFGGYCEVLEVTRCYQ